MEGAAVSRKRRARLGREDGAVLVEAAFAFPVLILLVLGILEFGLIFKDALTVTSATRAGARVASALSRQINYQTSTQASVLGLLSPAVNTSGIQYLTIYKADGSTGKPVDGDFETCTTCYRYTWNDSTKSWADQGVSWAWDQQFACGGATDTDYVGVYVRYRHAKLTGLFGSAQTLTDSTVMRLEPIASNDACKPGP
jgi:hypothetical protein